MELGHKEELGFVEDPCPGSGSGPWHTCVPRAAPAGVAVAHGCPGGGRDQAAARTPYALQDVITRCWVQAAARTPSALKDVISTDYAMLTPRHALKDVISTDYAVYKYFFGFRKINLKI